MSCFKDKVNRNRGTTLFEVLLYIGLFSIVSVATTYLYISIVRASDTLTLNLQKIELSIFMHQLTKSQVDMIPPTGSSPYVDVQKLKDSMERILKYYPNLKLINMQVEYMHVRNSPQIIDVRIGTNMHSNIKLTYQLQSQSVGQSKRIFSNTIYISPL